MRSILFVAILAIMSVGVVHGWWENGHMLTSQIAKNELKRVNSTIYERVEELIQALNDLTDQRTNEMVSAAVWMDDIKQKGLDFWDNWHFHDRPVNPHGLYLQLSEIEQTYNVVDAIRRAQLVLANDDGTNTTEKCMFMRFLLHTVGDMHQPLHGSNFYNNTFPTGDMGGNLDIVKTADNVTLNLHAYWDTGALGFQLPGPNWVGRPFNVSEAKMMEMWALDLTDRYPRTYFADRLQKKNTSDWTEESFRISSDIIYPGIKNTDTFTVEQQNNDRELCEQQVALGGYRLTDLILDIFSTYHHKQQDAEPEDTPIHGGGKIPQQGFPKMYQTYVQRMLKTAMQRY